MQKVPFTQVSNTVLNDKRLSWKAKGIFAYLYSKPEDWDFSAMRFQEDASDRYDSLAAGIKELETYGYLLRKKQSTGKTEYYISYEPTGEKAYFRKTQLGEFPTITNIEDTTNIEEETNRESVFFLSEGKNPNTYSKKPRSPRDFTNARRADIGKPPIQPKRTEKQDIAVQALKLIDYFKQQFYEMHGEGVDSYFRGDSSENSKMVKLAKGCVVFLGGDARAYVDDWLAGKGEFFSYDPSNAWSNSQMSKWKASKTMKKETQDFMPTI